MYAALRWAVTVLACVAVAAAFAAFKFAEITSSIESVAAQPEFAETVEILSVQMAEYAPSLQALGVAVARLGINSLTDERLSIPCSRGYGFRRHEHVRELLTRDPRPDTL